MVFEVFLQPGFELLTAIEQIQSPVLTAIFFFFHYLGEVTGYLILAPAIYWLDANPRGFKIILGLAACMYLNLLFKNLIDQPRPMALFPSFQPLYPVQDLSCPSGHAQLSAFFWTSLYLAYRRPWIIGLGVFLVLAIGFSRLYLGAHFPHDVVFGWIVGAATAAAFLWSTLFDRMVARSKYILLIIPALMFATPTGQHDFPIVGLITGMILGYRPIDLMALRIPARTTIIGLGLLIEVLIYIGIKKIDPSFPLAIVFLGYLALGYWISVGPYALVHRRNA